MMIKGIGNDIVEVSRIANSLKKEAFKQLVYHPDEIKYCEGKGNSHESYAARFAAKEAFLKAIGTGWSGKLALNEIAILNDDLGKPHITLSGVTKDLLAYLNCQIHVSVSHTKAYASAVVVLEEI